MHAQKIANGLGAANVGFHGRNLRRRRRRRLPDEPLHNPRAANHRGRISSIGGHLQNGGLRQKSSQRAARRQFHGAHGRATERRKAVVAGESIIGIDKIRSHYGDRRQVLANHSLEERARLLLHRFDQIVGEAVLGVQADVRVITANVAEVQPIVGEVANESVEAGADNEPFGLAAQYRWTAEPARACRRAQFGIWSRVG